jgi:hypothetical protein
MKTTIFSWGYYGWGSHTADLIEVVDAVEKSRGFDPPNFVDIRISRSVRAVGFNGAHFEKLLGEDRYVWMKSLGNQRIVSKKGPQVQIAEPDTVKDLLNLARSNMKARRRLIFFCSCPSPRCNGKIACHRTTVAHLLIRAAKKEKYSIEISEWPGSRPRHVYLDLNRDEFLAVRKGKTTVGLGDKPDTTMLGLPSYSVATFRSGGESFHRIVGPAVRRSKEWCLPVQYWFYDPEVGIAEYKKEANKLRRECGLDLKQA